MRSSLPMRADFPVFRCKARALIPGAMDSTHDSGACHSEERVGRRVNRRLIATRSDIGKGRLGRVPAEQGGGFAGGGPLEELSVFGGQQRFCLRRRLNVGAIDRWQYPVPMPPMFGRIEQASTGRYETLTAFLSCPYSFDVMLASIFQIRRYASRFSGQPKQPAQGL